MDSPKAKFTLFESINKLRKKLSINKEASMFIDCLIDKKDLDYHLKREDFQKIIEPILKKFEDLCQTFLEKANINLENIHSIEMVGNTLRTPILNDIVKKIFSIELSKTLVTDEIIARGCALLGMMKSRHKLNYFTFNHYNPYDIDIEFDNSKNEKTNINIFSKGSNYPLIKEYIINKNDVENKKIFY